jgi:integrase
MTAGMAREAVLRLLRGDDAPVVAPTLATFLTNTYGPWLAVHRKSAEKELYRLQALPWQALRLDQITVGVVEKHRTARLEEGRAPKTIDRDIAPLKAALTRAVDWDLLQAHPLTRLKPLGGDPNKVVRYLSAAEEKRLYAALRATEPWLRALVPVLLNTGIRRGEAFGLRWGDVDLSRRMLTVHGQTAKSGVTRHVPLNGTAVRALKQWRGAVAPMPEIVVFRRQEFRRSWVTLLKRARIENFRVHDCRHHFASRLAQTGEPLEVIRELLGHADLRMTLRYAHLAPEQKRKAVDKIG